MAPRRVTALSLLALLAFAPVARAQNPMAAVRENRWTDAEAAASGYADPIAGKLVTYLRLAAPNGGGVAEIAAFMAANPDWPNAALLERRREEALAREGSNPLVLTECARAPVQATDALLRCADAFSADG